ncbi:MAG TPA: DUF308 domain-containing protein [Bradyrhizobium sp.]|nr:DUF308 domain-containing protein [Bradyrhizobium sp.]
MMVVMLVAGIGCLLVGLLAITFGIPVKEFSFGNTLILTGAVTACTGLIVLGLWVVVRELKGIAHRLGPGVPMDWTGAARQLAAAQPRHHPAEDAEHVEHAEPDLYPAAPWLGDAAARERPRNEAPSAPDEATPAAKPRRNLMFSSSSRRERERAQARSAADQSRIDNHATPPLPPPVQETSEPPPATFEDAWPKSERARSADASLRRGRAPSTFNETSAGAAGAERRPAAGGNENQQPVTVLKSGVVDGMAYSLYSDGSIEAQMPEGMMRFASIDELRAHLDQRP